MPEEKEIKDWKDLPIIIQDYESIDEWTRLKDREGTVGELLETWDIEDLSDKTAMPQVLRHLRDQFNK